MSKESKKLTESTLAELEAESKPTCSNCGLTGGAAKLPHTCNQSKSEPTVQANRLRIIAQEYFDSEHKARQSLMAIAEFIESQTEQLKEGNVSYKLSQRERMELRAGNVKLREQLAAKEKAHREEIFRLNDKCVEMTRARDKEIERLTNCLLTLRDTSCAEDIEMIEQALKRE